MISVVVISKDEPALAGTLDAVAAELATADPTGELIVVDASRGRLDAIRRDHPDVRWFDFVPPAGVAISIPHQRNESIRRVQGEIVVFVDCGCIPEPGWLATLVAPILAGEESVCAGRAVGSGPVDLYSGRFAPTGRYLEACPTINLALRRELFDQVGNFDETFEYGSDVDLSWRLRDAGVRLRHVPEALVWVDWGDRRRQLRRSWKYGRAKGRLYGKHPDRLRRAASEDQAPFAYALFLLGLPVVLITPAYLALLIIPAVRNRGTGAAITVVDHLLLGAGLLRQFAAEPPRRAR